MTPEQCLAARQAVGLSAAALAKAAGLERMEVERFETGEEVPAALPDQLQKVLEIAGVEFTVDDRGSPGVKRAGGSQRGPEGGSTSTIGPGSNPPIDEDAT